MVDYDYVKNYIVDNFYGLLSFADGGDIEQETLESIIDGILREDVKFKKATNGLTPLMRAALESSVKFALAEEIYNHDGTEADDARLSDIIKLWKGK